jgi:hypothetical protein
MLLFEILTAMCNLLRIRAYRIGLNVISSIGTNVSEKSTASIFRVENGDHRFLLNVGDCYTNL